jgi:hypothetical protein
MTNRKTETSDSNTAGNTVKDPEDWVTGDEPMTGAQRSYLKTLCEEAQEPMDESLTKPRRPNESGPCSSGRGAALGLRRMEPSLMQATPKDVLTPDVVRVTEDMEMRAVARPLGHKAIAGAPVVDGEGHVVGLISQRDLLDHALTPFPEGLPATTVRDIMTPVAVTVGEDIPLNEVALPRA